jgi:hypothetical protein
MKVWIRFIMKGAVFWGMTPCGLVEVCHFSEDRTTSILRLEFLARVYFCLSHTS